jgi:hypothetical protein
MPCYKPIKALRSKEGGITFNPKHSEGMDIRLPCGQCIGCRVDRSRQWAVRCMHEASLHPNNCFLTLTYNNENLPPDTGLVKEHFQKFMKRFRKKIQPHKVRYYMCGEYGEKSNRPHYHAIIFNYDPPDKLYFQKNHQGDVLYTSEIFQKLWPYGFVTVGDVTFQSAAYVARYVMKKITGEQADEHYTRYDSETGEIFKVPPEYSAMSRRPGIGKEWFDKYHKDVFPDDFCVDHNGKKVKTPDYYLKLLEEKAPHLWDEIKHNRTLSLEKNNNDLTDERLEVREKCHEARLTKLERNL